MPLAIQEKLRTLQGRKDICLAGWMTGNAISEAAFYICTEKYKERPRKLMMKAIQSTFLSKIIVGVS